MTEGRTGIPWLAAGLLLLVLSGAVVAAFDSPTLIYVAISVGHVAGGVVWLFPLAALLARREARAMRALAGLLWLASAGTAAFLMAKGNLTVYRPVLRAHVAASVLGSWAVLWLLLARRGTAADPRERTLARACVASVFLGLLLVPAWLQWRRAHPRVADRIENP